MLAVAVFPFPPSVEVTAVVTLFCSPALIPVTLAAKLHVTLAASAAPESTTLVEPAAAVIVPPPQLPEIPFGVETTRPAGSISVNPTPLRELLAFGLETVKVSEVAEFRATLGAPNAFEIVGGAILGGGGVIIRGAPATTRGAPQAYRRDHPTRSCAQFHGHFSGCSPRLARRSAALDLVLRTSIIETDSLNLSVG